MRHHPAPKGFRTIVVGHDGSPQADDALRLALQLMDRRDGRLVLANVFPFYRGWALTAVTPGAYATLLQQRAQETLTRVSATLPDGIERSLVTLSDSSVARGLHDIADNERADLVVLGSSHLGVVGRLANRTTVQRLLHGAPCAIAVAAPERRPATLRRIGVAYDGSPEAVDALEAAYALAARDGATVHVSRASEAVPIDADDLATAEEQARLQDLADTTAARDIEEAVAAAPAGVVAEGTVVQGRAGPALLEDLAGVDLIVCGSRSYGPLRRALAGSTALALLAHARLPVLVVPRPASPVNPAPATPELEEAR